MLEALNPDGSSRGRYGPYTLAQIREVLKPMMDSKDHVQLEFAIDCTQKSPGSPFDLTDIREKGHVQYIAWSARLTWFIANGG